MIAILQMLFSIPEFLDYFYYFKFPLKRWYNEPNFEKHPFTLEIHLLTQFVFSRNPDLAKIGYLRNLSKDEFTLYLQHDACKYMLHLFESLQNELNPSVPFFVSSRYKNYAEAWMEYSNQHNSIIDELFVGMYETVFSCDKCCDETRIYEEFINIPLVIESDERGSKYLEFFKNQKETSPSEYHCSG